MLLADAGHALSRLARRSSSEHGRAADLAHASSSTCAWTTCRTRCSSTAPPSAAVARALSRTGWRAGIHVVTPNKKANSADLAATTAACSEARRAGGAHYLYEATVGAGLPVIQTLRDLRETGDEITSIEGIFSGTLAYLFNVYDGSTPFSAIVRERDAARLHRAGSAR